MSEYSPLYSPGQAFTAVVSAPVVGGQVLEVSGPSTVAPASAGSTKVIGVAGFDTDGRVTIFRGGVQRPVAASAITAGDQVVAAANGQVAADPSPAPGAQLGTALTSAAAGAVAEVAWIR